MKKAMWKIEEDGGRIKDMVILEGVQLVKHLLHFEFILGPDERNLETTTFRLCKILILL